MVDERLGRAGEGVHGLGVGACLGSRDPLVHHSIVPDPRREAPEVHGDEEVTDGVGLFGRPDPVAEDLVEKPVAPAPCPVENEAPDAVRVRDGELLRDGAAHRRPDDVRPLETERVHERGGVGCEVGDAEWTVGRG